MMQQEVLDQSTNMSSQLISSPTQLINCIAKILDEILNETDILEMTKKTIFHAPKRPSITLQQYLGRIAKYCGCSSECYIIALIYIDLIQQKNAEIVINSLCVHRFLMTAVVIAIKYHDDEYYKNEFYAKVGGITKSELKQLEMEFLNYLEFRVHISVEDFWKYRDRLQKFGDI